MRKMRSVLVGLAALGLVAVASAQFDGPAPLAWRWFQPTSIPPAGAPVVNGDTIYTAVGSRVCALDRQSGNKLWQFPSVDPIDGVFHAAPVLGGGLLVAAGDNKQIYAIDPNTGNQKWIFSSPVAVMGQPVVTDHYYVYEENDNTINSIDLATGEASWTQAGPYPVYSGLVGAIGTYKDSVLFFNQRNELVSLNITSRKFDWTLKLTQVKPDAIPVVFGDRVYFNSGPYLIAVDAATGAPRWQVMTNEQLISGPVVSATGVVVETEDGKILAYGLDKRPYFKTPLDLGSYPLPLVRPSAIGSKFLFPTSNGAINLVDVTQAKILWTYILRPLPSTVLSTPSKSGNSRGPGGSGPGGGGPGGGGPGGGGPGGGGGTFGGFGGQGRGGNSSTKPVVITSIPVSGQAVLAGTTLIVPARDGSIFGFDKDLGVDLTPPKVTMTFPNAGDQVSSRPPLQLDFKLEDEASGVNPATLKVEIDGKPFEYTYKNDGSLSVVFSSTGKNKYLVDGRKTIVITVSDWLGNEAKVSFGITIDNSLPPVIIPGSDQNKGRNGGPGMGGGPGKGGGGGGGDGR